MTQLKNLGYNAVDVHSYTHIRDSKGNTVASIRTDIMLKIDTDNITDMPLPLFNLIIAYTTTPIEDRKDAPLYLVEIPDLNGNRSNNYLCQKDNGLITIIESAVNFAQDPENIRNRVKSKPHFQFTETQINAIDERFMAFAVHVDDADGTYHSTATKRDVMNQATDTALFEFDKFTGTITGYLGGKGTAQETLAVVIPAEIDSVAVTHIGDKAFANTGIASVVIPDSVTSIGEEAFADNNLTAVVIPDSVTSIGYGAFQTNHLKTVTLSSALQSIGDIAFFFNDLTSVVIPDGVTHIPYGAFFHNKLTSVEIPESVTLIGEAAFTYNHLSTVTISREAHRKSSKVAFDKKVKKYTY